MRHRHDELTKAVKEILQKGRAGIPLSRESELELLSAYCEAPNATTKGVLRNEFLCHYLYLVSSEVKHVQKRGDGRSIDELMALGTKGLLYALEQVEKFAEKEGIDELDFAVYATTRIKQALVERGECKGLLRAFEHFVKNAEDAGEDFAELVKFPIYARPWVRMAVRPSYKEYKELVKRGKRKKIF